MHLGELEVEASTKPYCPYCGCRVLRRKEWVHRKVWDIKGPVLVRIKRYKCTDCGKTFSHYPEGISWKSPYSQRVWFLSALLWHLGLSVESVALILRALTGARISPNAVHKHLVEMGLDLNQRLRARKSEMLRVIHIDQGYIRIRGKSMGFNLAVSPDGKLLDISFVGNEDVENFRRFFRRLKKRHGTYAIVGDFHAAHERASEDEGMVFAGCWFHHQRSMFKRARGARDPTLRDIYNAATLPFPELEEEFFQAGLDTDDPRLKEVLFFISDRYHSVNTLNIWGLGPGFVTNNSAERAIARSKIRYKLTRGFGSRRNAYAALLITQAFGQALETGEVSPQSLFA